MCIKTYEGSGIICVLLTTLTLLSIMGLVVRYTSYGIDIAHQRLLHEQRYFALKGLLNYGIAHAKKFKASDSEQSMFLTIQPNEWLSPYHGTVNIKKEDQNIIVHASLYIESDKFIESYYST